MMRACAHETRIRPVLSWTGLFYCMIACMVHDIASQGVMEYPGGFAGDRNLLICDTLPDSRQWLNASGSFDGIYFARLPGLTSDVYAHRSSLTGGFSSGPWKLAGTVSYKATRLYVKNQGESFYLDGAGLEQKSAFAVERQSGPILVRGWIGVLGAPGIKNNSVLGYAGSSYLPAPLTGGASGKSSVLSARIQFGLCRDMVGTNAIKLTNTKTYAFRTFSYALAEDRFWGSVDRAIGFHFVRFGAACSIYKTDRLTAIPFPMPLSGKFRFLRGDGAWRYGEKRWGTGVTLEVCSGGGYVAGYDDSGIRFALADSIGERKIGVSVDFYLPGKLGVALSARQADATCPFGYLNTAPFSAWAMVEPLEYHLRKGNAAIQEIILSVTDTIKNGRWKIVPGASIFNTRIATNCVTKELKAMLLIPYYTNIDTLKPIRLNSLMLAIGCTCSYRTGPWCVEGFMMQNAIPLKSSFQQEINGRPSSGTAGNPSDRENRRRFSYGGLRLGIAMAVAIPEK